MARLTALPPRLSRLDTRIAAPPPKPVEPHYATPEHRRWRRAVVARAGGRCEAPGCGRAEPRMFADHVVELRDGGSALDLANGRCLCGSCHSKKTHRQKVLRQSTFARGRGV
jgi:5-methylcytosine-specific restriction endonuclease McrA